jgi:hypothetical protein
VFFTKNDDFVLASYLIRSRFIQELGEGKTLLEISRGAVPGWRDEASAPRAGEPLLRDRRYFHVSVS